MKIRFNVVRFKNFMAVGNDWLEIVLNSAPNTLIYGDNGAGKTTFVEAICYCLFRKAYRDINKPLLVNSINKKHMVVEVEFSVGTKEYKVVRGTKPEIFEIWVDGKLKDQEGVIDYQRYLENDVLKMNFKTFSQIIVLCNKNYKPFMELPAADRRNFIESLLDIGIFSDMQKVAKTRLNIVDDKITELKRQIQVIKDKIDIHERNIKEAKQNKQEIIDNNKIEIANYKSRMKIIGIEIGDLEKSIKSYQDITLGKDGLANKLKTLNNLCAKITANYDKASKEIHFLENNDTCPTCYQDIHTDIKDVHLGELHEKQVQFSNGKKEIEIEIENIQKDISEMEEHLKKISQCNIEIEKKRTELDSILKWIVKLDKDNHNLRKSALSLEEENIELSILNRNLENQKLSYASSLNDKQYLEKASTMLKDSGIKTLIIKQYLPAINKSINKYLSVMDFFVNFSLNEEFEESIKNRFIDDFSYGNFSDGQKLRLNLAVLFSWISIAKMKNSIDTNLLILDEILDSSLDLTGTEDCLKLIQNFSKETNVFVISPKPEQFLDKFNRTIKFALKNNFSEIVEDD